MSNPVFEKHVDEHGNVSVQISQDVVILTREEADQVRAKLDHLQAENAELREGLAISIPLPLDDDRSAIHPDDIIGYNINGTDFFGRVTEMHLTRYPRDGQPAMWVVTTEDDDGSESPFVCWGGRCRAVHKKASQTYSAEYIEVYDENKRLKAENAQLQEQDAKLRELCVDYWRWMCSYPHNCINCEHNETPNVDRPNAICGFMRRMSELGIEVPHD